MDTSIIVARILAIVYVSFGLGLLFSNGFYRKAIPELIDNSAVLLYGGFMAVVFGYLILHYHHTWKADWTTIITVIGWIALIKGVVLLIFPNSFARYKDSIFHKDKLMWYLQPLTLILGLVLAFFGFVW